MNMSGDSVIPRDMLWNEAEVESDDPLNKSLLMLMVIRPDLVPQLIGTAFIVTADFSSATAISAAHCFEGIRSVLRPDQLHHPSTPSEFLLPPGELDLKSVKAVYTKSGKVFICDVELAIWDSATDLAALTVIAPPGEKNLFDEFIWVTDKIPSVGDEVAMFGYGEMETRPADAPGIGVIKRRLIVRVGTTESIHPEGYYRLKAPCVQTSIQVYSGMSGGVVARWTLGKQIEAFGFVSHSMTLSPSDVRDRSVSGQSMASILNAKIEFIADKKQAVSIAVNNIGVGKTARNK